MQVERQNREECPCLEGDTYYQNGFPLVLCPIVDCRSRSLSSDGDHRQDPGRGTAIDVPLAED
jgi:hypothetical protein